MISTVFFDLDDTLFDHRHSRRCGLLALKNIHPALASADLRAMEDFHEQLTWAEFDRVLSGEIALQDAITRRICTLCTRFGRTLDPSEVPQTVRQYDAAYRKNRRAVPGSRNLLAALHGRVRVGIITNGFCILQQEKIAVCDISPHVDVLVVSEEAGCRKPEPAIFKTAMERAGAVPEESVYIGDSWEVDIVPALRAGMKAIWLNRYGRPCPDPSLAREFHSYADLKTGDLLV